MYNSLLADKTSRSIGLNLNIQQKHQENTEQGRIRFRNNFFQCKTKQKTRRAGIRQLPGIAIIRRPYT
jgi:hypothetical protein